MLVSVCVCIGRVFVVMFVDYVLLCERTLRMGLFDRVKSAYICNKHMEMVAVGLC